jgi:hypothetical protein
MKVIFEKRRRHLIRYLRFNYNYRVDTSAGGLVVPDVIIHPVVNIATLTWL